jgi:hypothetical protein
MRQAFEKDRSLKKLQSQVRELETSHPSYPEVVINLVNAHNRRTAAESTLTKEICGIVEQDACYLAMEQICGEKEVFTKSSLLDDYLRDAISRFVVNEL